MESKIDRLLNQLLDLHPKFIDLSLDRLNILLEKLGNPHFKLPKTIHIAGTNGKGSTLSFIKNILISNGYLCDAYISPHLANFNERVIINNKEITSEKLFKILTYVKKINENKPITFFEITTAAAFMLFAKSKADFLILETGLGGRLDATNIIPSKLISIITPISIDHQEFLGKTIKKITKEKLAITKLSKNIIISKQTQEVKKLIKLNLIKNKNVHYFGKDFGISNKFSKNFIFRFKKNKFKIENPQLLGDHQIENASVALASAIILKKLGFQLNNNLLSKSIKNTVWPGRLELIKYNNKKIILDGSHNIDGSKKLNDFLIKNKIKPIVLFGMLNNKNIYEFLKILQKNIKEIIPVEIPNEKNTFSEIQIVKNCKKLSLNCIRIKNLSEKIKYLNKSNEEYILITGSLYLVGKIRKKFL